jgi:hypothetical protein
MYELPLKNMFIVIKEYHESLSNNYRETLLTIIQKKK